MSNNGAIGHTAWSPANAHMKWPDDTNYDNSQQ